MRMSFNMGTRTRRIANPLWRPLLRSGFTIRPAQNENSPNLNLPPSMQQFQNRPENIGLERPNRPLAPLRPSPDTRCARVQGRELVICKDFLLSSGSSPCKATAEAEGGWEGASNCKNVISYDMITVQLPQ